MAQPRTITGFLQAQRTLGGMALLGGLLVIVLVLAARTERSQHGVVNLAGVSVALAFALAGVALSLVLFARDSDLRGFKQTLVGLVTGAGVVTAGDLIKLVRERIWWSQEAIGQTRATGVGFFLNAAAAIIGVLVGFLLVRFWLDRALAEESVALDHMLRGVNHPDGVPWPEAKGTLGPPLSDDELKKLEHICDWRDVPVEIATRAGIALLQKDRAANALAPLEHAVMEAEPPSPAAFDYYAAALVDAAGKRTLDSIAIARAERAIARMLIYWEGAYLVNLDVGFLYLYMPGRAADAERYSRRALEIRPLSPSASFNVACALAALVGDTPSDAKIDEITGLLDIYLRSAATAPGDFDSQGDFDALKANPRFAAWLDGWRTSKPSSTQ